MSLSPHWCVFTQLQFHVCSSRSPAIHKQSRGAAPWLRLQQAEDKLPASVLVISPPASRGSSMWNLFISNCLDYNLGKSQQTGISPLKNTTGKRAQPSPCSLEPPALTHSAPAACGGNAGIWWSTHQIERKNQEGCRALKVLILHLHGFFYTIMLDWSSGEAKDALLLLIQIHISFL